VISAMAFKRPPNPFAAADDEVAVIAPDQIQRRRR